ncbi:MAG: RluA family pseudouridine synthase [Zoogloeaceae bacterium]|nr:RluA family pseudouridine synthase [Zoogloeaceae bacterium]
MSETKKNSVTWRKIDAEESGQRLDNFLVCLCKGVPKSHLYKVVRNGEVRVNKKRADASYRLRAGDMLRLPPLQTAAKSAVKIADAPNFTLPVCFEDEALLAIDKPSGLAAHGGSGVSLGVIELLRARRPAARFLELAHRLDKDTSGILLIAKKRAALVALHEMFRSGGGAGAADKRYLILVQGRWQEALRKVRLPLYKYLTESGERRVRVDEKMGKDAHTLFRLIARWERFSLLEGQLKTGRTHQLRVHLAHLGFPILGDEKYGDFALNRALQKEGLKRMALHAFSMDLPHPQEAGRRLKLCAPLPEALLRFIHVLDATGNREETAFGKQHAIWHNTASISAETETL